jgi:hypothetical protein
MIDKISLQAESANEELKGLGSDLCRLRDAGRAMRLDARSVCAPTAALNQQIGLAAADLKKLRNLPKQKNRSI